MSAEVEAIARAVALELEDEWPMSLPVEMEVLIQAGPADRAARAGRSVGAAVAALILQCVGYTVAIARDATLKEVSGRELRLMLDDDRRVDDLLRDQVIALSLLAVNGASRVIRARGAAAPSRRPDAWDDFHGLGPWVSEEWAPRRGGRSRSADAGLRRRMR